MIVVIMGVAGSGKTTVGCALATRLGWTFLDADAFHSADSVAKMRSGEPLTDTDRGPWLDAMRRRLVHAATCGESVVLACSALKRTYRQQLEPAARAVRWVHLHVDPEAAQSRLAQRQDHFMPADLIDSQFATLEPPDATESVLTVDACEQLDAIVEAIVQWLDD